MKNAFYLGGRDAKRVRFAINGAVQKRGVGIFCRLVGDSASVQNKEADE